MTLKSGEICELENADLHALINCTDDQIWSVNPEMKLVAANAAFYRSNEAKTGITLIPGDNLIDGSMYPEDIVLFWEKCYNKAFAGHTFREEFFTPAFNNCDASWIETEFKPIIQQGRITGIACHSRDITEKTYAEKLRQSQKHLSEIQHLTKTGSWEFDIRHDRLIWSDELYIVFGTDRDTFKETHNSFLHLIVDEDIERVKETSRNAQKTGEPFTVEYRIITPSGENRIIREHGFSKKDALGNITDLFGTAQDVTEIKVADAKIKEIEQRNIADRKRAEGLIRESEAKYRSFFESSVDGILIKVTDGEILAANPAACEMFRMTEAEICAAGWFGLVDTSDPRIVKLIEERRQHGKARGEVTLLRKGGIKFEADLSSGVITDSYGQVRTSMIIKDISERKLADEKLAATTHELEQALKSLKKVMDSSMDVICAVDAQGNFIKVSAASESVWGYKPEELIGKQLINYVYAEDQSLTQQTAAHVMEGNSFTHFENRYIHKNGSLVPIEWSARWDETDQIRYGVARDVTEKKKLEKAVAVERHRFHGLYLQAPSCLGILKGPDHVYELANPEYLALIHKTDIIGRSVKEVLPEMESQGIFEILDNVYKTGKTFSANEMLVQFDLNGDGNLMDSYLNFIYQAHRNSEGEIDGILFFANDVSEQVFSRKRIEESEQRYRQIVETAQEGIWLIDENSATTFVNSKMCEILEYNESEMMGREIYDFMDDESRQLAVGSIQKKREGHSEQKNFKYITKSGKEVWTNISSNPLFAEDGRYIGALAMVTDISQRKTAEEKNIQSEIQIRNFAKHLNRVQEDDRAHIAREIHDELGQELVGIKIGLSSFFRSGDTTPIFQKHIRNMIGIVEESIQSVRKIATKLRPGILDTLGLAASLQWLGREFERKTGIPCEMELYADELNLDKDLPICFFRICQESLTNIIKHANCSRIKIRLTKENNLLTLHICDNGKGMANEKLENPFSMGLLGMKERARNVGGFLKVISTPDKGTTIELSVLTE